VYAVGIGICSAETNLDKEIALARSVAPDAISRGATIVVNGKVVIEGSNG